ncbi:dihydrofolate reductase [Liquorilactobacillus sicerae]|uniref:dihydrofolate reductase n=1 Tax=Liquorilactobacillus sicerae TaxID=1416943 RepID=UPI002480391E|nr:dihydrofolate reductase [Liquorilactobacillus sicerae]
MLAFIWAEDVQHHIGYRGKLPWHLPADLAHFKRVTLHHPIIMGRRTFESFPGLLPQRHHYLLTHDQKYDQQYAGNSQITIVHTKQELKKILQDNSQLFFIIGGASLFTAFADQVNWLYVTKIAADFPGDVKMPPIPGNFELVWAKKGKMNSRNCYPYQFKLYRRRTEQRE